MDDTYTTILHLGPSPSDIGGMQSVLRSFRYHSSDLLRFVVWPTYTRRGKGRSLRLFSAAVARILGGTIKGFDVAHVHASYAGSMVRAALLLSVASLRGLPTVLTLHGSRFRTWAEKWSGLARFVLQKADAITVLSNANCEAVCALTDAEIPVFRIPNFVTLNKFAPRRPSECQDVIFAGELSRRKGLDILVSAWKKIEGRHLEHHLLIAGPTGDLAPPFGSHTIDYLGVLWPEAVRELIRNSRFGVLPSRAEAMPMFVLETMAEGRPIVTSDIEDLSDLVVEGGCTVEPGNVGELARQLDHRLEEDEVVDVEGQRARELMEDNHSPEAIMDLLREIYLGVMTSHQR